MLVDRRILNIFWNSAETNTAVATFFVKWDEVALTGGQRELWETM